MLTDTVTIMVVEDEDEVVYAFERQRDVTPEQFTGFVYSVLDFLATRAKEVAYVPPSMGMEAFRLT